MKSRNDDPLDQILREVARAPHRAVPATGAADILVGAKLGRYVVEARLGAGGMGTVYRASDETLGREVALKILHGADQRQADLLREARSAARIAHPNVVAIHDIADIDGLPVLVMELVRGTSLRERLAKGAIPAREAGELAAGIAAGLAAAHALGIVHGDLKPENVLVDASGVPKLVDFGLARADEPATDPDVASGGTPSYMAPEQFAGAVGDMRSDLYSFGVMVREVLLGRRPTVQEEGVGLIAVAPRPLARALERCLREDPGQRFESAIALCAALQEKRRRWSAVLAASVAIVALGVLGLVVLRRPPPAVAAPTPRRLTFNSSEAPVRTAALSPDGRVIAFGEPRGVFVQDIASGARRQISLGRPVDASAVQWTPDGSALFVVDTIDASHHGDVWLAPLEGPFRLLRTGVLMASLAPDGVHLAYVTSEGLAWSTVDRPDDAHHVTDRAAAVDLASVMAWHPSSRGFVFSRLVLGERALETTLEIASLDPPATHVVLRDPRLRSSIGEAAFTYARDKLIVALGEGPTVSLSSLSIDVASGRTTSPLHEIMRFAGPGVTSLTTDRAGARLVFVRHDVQGDVWIARLAPDASKLEASRRVTLSDADERPSGFTPEGKLLVTERESGATRALEIDPATGLGRPLSTEALTSRPIAGPRGRGILWWRRGVLVYQESTGRPGQDVASFPESGATSVHCAVDADACVLARVAGNATELFDVDLAAAKLVPRGLLAGTNASWGFALSRSGDRIAIRDENEHRIAIASRGATRTRSIAVDAPCFIQFLSWAADDESIVATGICATNGGAHVMHVDVDGKATTLVASPNWIADLALSADGRDVTFAEVPFHGDVWLLDGLGL